MSDPLKFEGWFRVKQLQSCFCNCDSPYPYVVKISLNKIYQSKLYGIKTSGFNKNFNVKITKVKMKL